MADPSPAAAIAKRFRKELLRLDIESVSAAARRAGVRQQWLSDRLNGITEWKVSELQRVCAEIGAEIGYVIGASPPPPEGGQWQPGWNGES